MWEQEDRYRINPRIERDRSGETVPGLVDPLIGIIDIRTNLRIQRASLVIFCECKRVERKVQALGAGGIRSRGGTRGQRNGEEQGGGLARTFSKRSPIMQFCHVRPVISGPQGAGEEEDEAFMIAKMLGSSFGGLDDDQQEKNRQLTYHYIPQDFSVPITAASKVVHAGTQAYNRDPDLFIRPSSEANTSASNCYGSYNKSPSHTSMSPTSSVIQLCNDALTPAQQSDLLPPQPLPLPLPLPITKSQQAYMPPLQVRDSSKLKQDHFIKPVEQEGLSGSMYADDDITLFSSLGSPGYVRNNCYEKTDFCMYNDELPRSVFESSKVKSCQEESVNVMEEPEIFTLDSIHALLDDTLNMTKR